MTMTYDNDGACAIAAMDAAADAAMADFRAAADKLHKLPAGKRRPLQKQCEEASFRWNALRYAMTAYPAQSKRGLLAQVREVGKAAMCGDADRAARLVKVLRDGVEALVADA